MWAALKVAGVPIARRGHRGNSTIMIWNQAVPTYATHWRRCCQEASAADIVLILAQSDENQNGAFLEVGAGLENAEENICGDAVCAASWLAHEDVTSVFVARRGYRGNTQTRGTVARIARDGDYRLSRRFFNLLLNIGRKRAVKKLAGGVFRSGSDANITGSSGSGRNQYNRT